MAERPLQASFAGYPHFSQDFCLGFLFPFLSSPPLSLGSLEELPSRKAWFSGDHQEEPPSSSICSVTLLAGHPPNGGRGRVREKQSAERASQASGSGREDSSTQVNPMSPPPPGQKGGTGPQAQVQYLSQNGYGPPSLSLSLCLSLSFARAMGRRIAPPARALLRPRLLWGELLTRRAINGTASIGRKHTAG